MVESILHGIHILLLALAVLLCAWAFRRSRRKGYLLLAAYSLLLLFSLVAVPALNRWRDDPTSPTHGPDSNLTREQSTRLYQKIDRAKRVFYEQEGLPSPGFVWRRTFNVPFAELLFVTGLWLLARKAP